MKLKLWLIASVAVAYCAGATAEYKEGYYDLLEGKDWVELKRAAKECVAQHKRLVYTDLPNHWVNTDVYPEKYPNYRDEECLRFWDMYSDNIYLIFPNQAGKTAFSINAMQREHAVPKSWWKTTAGVEYTPAYSDLWNLYPSDGPANQAKSNYPLGITRTTSFDNGVSKIGTPETGTGGGSGRVFEPDDRYKGDFARAFFYMATVYDDLAWSTATTYNMYEQNSWPTLKEWAVNLLLDWARRDPVSEKEIARNDAVEVEQGNRNPYIDFPELVEYIWGTRIGEKFYQDQQGNLPPAGLDDVEISDGQGIGVTDTGLCVIAPGGVSELRVFDISGRVTLYMPYAEEGLDITLPRGIYVVRYSGSQAPIKLIVR